MFAQELGDLLAILTSISMEIPITIPYVVFRSGKSSFQPIGNRIALVCDVGSMLD